MKTYGERGCIDPRFLGLCTSWKEPRFPLYIWGWEGPRTGLDDVEGRTLRIPGLKLRPLGRSARNQSLYRLRYPCSPANVTRAKKRNSDQGVQDSCEKQADGMYHLEEGDVNWTTASKLVLRESRNYDINNPGEAPATGIWQCWRSSGASEYNKMFLQSATFHRVTSRVDM
jgi:hypothetical protein